MCGIAGIVALEGFNPSSLIAMTNLVSYRGPDGFGFVYIDVKSGSKGECSHNREELPDLSRPTLGFGARRLAILDLSALGLQPMQIDDGDYWITYNGEIYNYVEIRCELESKGEVFLTQTDTEVILRAYRQWGDACVKRFNGMWAFAIWDRKRRKIFCSRDRFGVKPFYYCLSGSQLIFGSEIKQLLSCPGVPRTANVSTLMPYLEQGVQDHSDQTFFAGIQQLLPGHSATGDLSGDSILFRIEKYWELPLGPENLSEEAVVEQFLAHLERSIKWRLRSDVPVGSCLSGGLDSSSVVMLANRAKRSLDFHAFSSCFEEAAIDERQYMREVILASGVTPHYVFPRAELFWDDLNCLIWHQDEPFGGTGVYAQWCVMKAARQAGIPVLLDGQGGDEILCGYRKFYIFYLWELFKQGSPRVIPEGIAWLRNVGQIAWSKASVNRYVPSLTGGKESIIARIGSPELMSSKHKSATMSLGAGAGIRERQKDDLRYYSIPALLHYEDRNSMAHSIEARVPMLDYELAQFAVNCPANFKLRGGWTKWMLREALRGVLPEAVRLRRSKLGFSTPQEQWLRQDVRGTLHSLIQESKLKMGRWLSLERVRRELTAFVDGETGCLDESQAFRVLNLELWARAFNVC